MRLNARASSDHVQDRRSTLVAPVVSKQKHRLAHRQNFALDLAGRAFAYVLTPLYRVGHPVSMLMAWRWLKGAPVSRQWIDLAAVSPYLPRAVVAAEDAHFCKHHGVDWGALREVINDAEEGEALRGASTITQQVAKNLFLWPIPGPIRKLLEFPLAMWIDRRFGSEPLTAGSIAAGGDLA
jgi:Transglycosylase